MGYDQGPPPHGASSWPQQPYYDQYSYAYAHHTAASYYQPPPPGTEGAAPAAAFSSSSSSYSAAGALHNVVVQGPGHNPSSVPAMPQQPTGFPAPMGGSGPGVGHPAYYDPQHPPPHQHPAAVRPGVEAEMTGLLMVGAEVKEALYIILTYGMEEFHHHAVEDEGGDVEERALIGEAQPGNASAPAHGAQVTATNFARGPVVPAAWCDICRVECNSKEILEQHKNGKRHKRTVQKMQDRARLQGMTPAVGGMGTLAYQAGGVSATSSQLTEVEGPSNALHMVPPLGSSNLGGEHKDLVPGTAVSAVSGVQLTEVTGSSSQQNTMLCTTAVGHSVESQVELHAAVQACEPSNATGPSNVQPVAAVMNVSDSRNSAKRKQTGAVHGGKKPKVYQTPRQRPDRVREQPIVCTICNVTCDTRAVFDIHLGGKKHQSRLKRSQGPGTTFGPLGAHIPPNQPVAHPTGAPELIYYGLKSHCVVEQEAYLCGAIQHPFPAFPQAGPTVMAAEGVTYPGQPGWMSSQLGSVRLGSSCLVS
ncbi:hypothetical protein U9M48_007962 [Paspalum notatum var. saurae]|uniref:U1-type domain-containing protein n=1 Tax=Paspalum notatum var. saurae TaxID=547442 RepID=A0AAQ3WCI6_PASNO